MTIGVAVSLFRLEPKEGTEGERGALQKILTRDAHLRDFWFNPKMTDVKVQSPKYNSIMFGPPRKK